MSDDQKYLDANRQEGEEFMAMKAGTVAAMAAGNVLTGHATSMTAVITGPVVVLAPGQADPNDWQSRVIAERDALQSSLEKHGKWLGSTEGNKPGTAEHDDAILQYSGMEMYLRALNNRIKKFEA